jgi:hypothetical protein
MTGVRIRQCPRCELRFTSSSELEDHLSTDHRPSPPPEVPHTSPSPSPVQTSSTSRSTPSATSSPAIRPGGRLLVWLLVLTCLVVAALVIWLVSTPAALVVAAVVALGAAYTWRAHARAERHRACPPR